MRRTRTRCDSDLVMRRVPVLPVPSSLPCMHGDMGAGELASARAGWGTFGWTLVAAPNFDQTGLSDGSSGWAKGPAKYQWQTVGRGEWRSGAGGNFAPDTGPREQGLEDASTRARGRAASAWMAAGMVVRSSWPLGSADRGASWSVLAAHSRSGIARIWRCEGSGRASHDMPRT